MPAARPLKTKGQATLYRPLCSKATGIRGMPIKKAVRSNKKAISGLEVAAARHKSIEMLQLAHAPALECCSLYFAKCALEPIFLERNGHTWTWAAGQQSRKCRENGSSASR